MRMILIAVSVGGTAFLLFVLNGMLRDFAAVRARRSGLYVAEIPRTSKRGEVVAIPNRPVTRKKSIKTTEDQAPGLVVGVVLTLPVYDEWIGNSGTKASAFRGRKRGLFLNRS